MLIGNDYVSTELVKFGASMLLLLVLLFAFGFYLGWIVRSRWTLRKLPPDGLSSSDAGTGTGSRR